MTFAPERLPSSIFAFTLRSWVSSTIGPILTPCSRPSPARQVSALRARSSLNSSRTERSTTALRGGDRLADKARSLSRGETDIGDRSVHFSERFGERLALLLREKPAELVAATLHLVRRLAHDVAALRGRSRAPLAERGRGGVDRSADIVRGRDRDLTEDLVGVCGVAIRNGLAGARWRPFAADVVQDRDRRGGGHGPRCYCEAAERSRARGEQLLARDHVGAEHIAK